MSQVKPTISPPELVRLLSAVGEGLGTLLENAQLDQELQTKREEMAAVDQVARIITSTLDIGEVYHLFAAEVGTLMDVDQLRISIVDEARDALTVSYVARGASSAFDQGSTITLQGTSSGYAAKNRETLIIDDLAKDTRFWTSGHLEKDGLKSALTVPLVSDDSVIGTIVILSKSEHAYGAREQVMLERLATQIAPAIETSLLFQEVEQHSLALESIVDAVNYVDLAGNIQFINGAFEQIFGYTPDDVLGKPVRRLAPIGSDGDAEIQEILESAIHGVWVRETKRVRKNGEEFPAHLTVAPVTHRSGQILGFVGVTQDLTERKQAEEERRALEIRALAQSKLATLGEMATGVAHEINQPLTYINSMIQSFQEDMRLNDLDMQRGQARLAESGRQVARITRIVDHLRTFGRREDTEMAEVNLAEVLDSTLLLVGERIRLRNIELERQVDEDLPPGLGQRQPVGAGLHKPFPKLNRCFS